MKKIVVTGNIGSGKSTICSLLVDIYKIPFFDADGAIREIYQTSQEFYDAIYHINPHFCDAHSVNKQKIIDHLNLNPDFIEILEKILYPLLDVKRKDFIQETIKSNPHTAFILFEVPLLFEKNLAPEYNFIILCYASYSTRLARTLTRPSMTQKKFDFMNNRQLPYEIVMDKADLAIETTISINNTKEILETVINQLTKS